MNELRPFSEGITTESETINDSSVQPTHNYEEFTPNEKLKLDDSDISYIIKKVEKQTGKPPTKTQVLNLLKEFNLQVFVKKRGLEWAPDTGVNAEIVRYISYAGDKAIDKYNKKMKEVWKKFKNSPRTKERIPDEGPGGRHAI